MTVTCVLVGTSGRKRCNVTAAAVMAVKKNDPLAKNDLDALVRINDLDQTDKNSTWNLHDRHNPA